MTTVLQRFLKYVTFDTKANSESGTTPSSQGQLVLANFLVNELKVIGLSNVGVDDKGYVTATLPSNTKGNIPTVGFVAHLDTSPDFSGSDVKPIVTKNYDGSDIVLNHDQNIVLKTSDFSELRKYIGNDIVTSDGTTLLGADDKAGVAEIVTAMAYLVEHPEIPHGEVRICFTPDEEIGQGADYFDVEAFNAEFAFTMDGGEIGELEYENFNAASANVTIHGRNIHPGYAKNKMLNALLVANEFISRLPAGQNPANTEGYEGFFHLHQLKGDVELCEFQILIRDFTDDGFLNRKKIVQDIALSVNQQFEKPCLFVDIKDQYFNMKQKIEPVKYIVDIAQKAIVQAGVKPLVKPIRGGTDGARLSFMGLPTPNIFAGGHNFHGRFEYVPVQSMEKAVEVIVNIVKLVADEKLMG